MYKGKTAAELLLAFPVNTRFYRSEGFADEQIARHYIESFSDDELDVALGIKPGRVEAATVADRFLASVNAGRALLAAQAKIPPDEWLGWLDANFDGSRETAAKYMQLAADCGH